MSISFLVIICYYFIGLFTCLSSPSSSSIRLAALWRRLSCLFASRLYPSARYSKVLPKQISMPILVKWKNQHSQWEFPGGSVVRTIAPLLGTRGSTRGQGTKISQPVGRSQKKKKKVKKPKNILKGSWDACLRSQEERFTVNVSKNSNETWCLSIPLPCKVLSAGIPFLLLVVITTALLSQSTQHHLSSILWRGTKFLVYCWGVPSLVCAPRPSGGRASPQATTGPSRRRSAVSCCKSAKSNSSSGEARSCRNLWLAANKGRAAGAPPREAWVGWSCRQSAGTDFPPLYLVYCGRKILENFQQIEPVAVLTACFRDWKHRRRQSYLQKTPLPPSIS